MIDVTRITVALHLMLVIFSAGVLLGVHGSPASAQTYKVAKTPEGVHRKAVITVGEAKLFKSASGDDASTVALMDVFFILEGGGAEGGRTPVSLDPDKATPSGWLEEGSFAEWNSVQMVDFAPQGGRKRVDVFNDVKCAIEFARTGNSAGPCLKSAIGREPDRQTKNAEYKMLVPVFRSQADKASVAYEGGFVRVTTGPVVQTVDPASLPNPEGPQQTRLSGYELVLVIDSTTSMQAWFKPTLEAVSDFISQVQGDLGTGEVQAAIRIGLLFYQDRKIGNECQLDYLTQWRVPLVETAGIETVEATSLALAQEKVTACGSDEPAEAVFDAVNRAILDPAWRDGSFRVVALIGDAPPHSPSNEPKNPSRLDRSVLHKLADEKNIRFISMRIKSDPGEDVSEFKNLALQRRQELVGRFNEIPAVPLQMRVNLGTALWNEWQEIIKPARALQQIKATRNDLLTDRAGLSQKIGGAISDYAYPIILNLLPENAGEPNDQSFSRGWIPQKIQDKSSIEEFIFISRASIRNLMGIMESILGNFEASQSAGADTFVSALRQTLATQLKVNPDDVFSQGEPLSSLLKKANVLPFDTGALRFTAEEINQWKPEDYKRVVQILEERLVTLREFAEVAGNIRSFGEAKYYYVPHHMFP